MQKEKPHLHIRHEVPPSSPQHKDLPTYTLDGLYTRDGKHCVSLLRKAVTGMSIYSKQQIGEAIFLLEAETLIPRLTSESWDNFRQESFFTIMESLGLDRDGYNALQRSLIKNFDLYNDIRLQHIKDMIKPDLFAGA